MALNADNWLKFRYPDSTCGGIGTLNVGLTKQQCPDCQGTGLDELRIQADASKSLIPAWVIEQRTLKVS